LLVAGGLLVGLTGRVEADSLHSLFVTLDRGDAASRIGIETSLSSTTYASDPVSRTTVWRSELYGQYVHASGFGVYAKLPLSYANHQFDKDEEGEGSLRTHNAEIGALYALRLAPAYGVIAQAGLVLPTLNDDALFRYRLAYDGSRAADALLSSASQVTALRLSASPMLRTGGLFARIDVGVDLVISSKEVEGGSGLPTVIARGGVGAGYTWDKVAMMAELVSYNTSRDGSLQTVALTGRVAIGKLRPYAAVILPLDSRGVDVAATLGCGLRL
jgi:hypothetical protein